MLPCNEHACVCVCVYISTVNPNGGCHSAPPIVAPIRRCGKIIACNSAGYSHSEVVSTSTTGIAKKCKKCNDRQEREIRAGFARRIVAFFGRTRVLGNFTLRAPEPNARVIYGIRGGNVLPVTSLSLLVTPCSNLAFDDLEGEMFNSRGKTTYTVAFT